MSEKKYLDSDGLVKLVANIINNFSAKIHSHTVSEISDYTIDSALSDTSTNPVQNNIVNSAIQSSLATAKEYTESIAAEKQNVITGTSGQFVIIGSDGYATVATIPFAEDGSY